MSSNTQLFSGEGRGGEGEKKRHLEKVSFMYMKIDFSVDGKSKTG